MEDVVVDCDVIGHSQNPSAGQNQTSAAAFLAELVGATTKICLDQRGFIFSEYVNLGLLVAPHPIVGAFFKTLNAPDRVCIVDEAVLEAAKRRFVGRLGIDKHDKGHLRTAACTVEKWLVSHDTTYDNHVDDIRDSIGVIVESSLAAVERLR